MVRPLLALIVIVGTSPALAADVPALIDADTTWTAAGGPWVLSSDVIVAEGSTLLIEPGALVQLASDVRLTIAGELVARGTAEAPIRFQGLPDAQQQPARWGSVVFLDSSVDASFEQIDEYVSGSVIEGAVLQGGTRAVIIEQAAPFLHDSTFRDNACCEDDPNGGAGVYVMWGSTPRIQGCTFENNVANGTSWGADSWSSGPRPSCRTTSSWATSPSTARASARTPPMAPSWATASRTTTPGSREAVSRCTPRRRPS